MSQEDLCSFFQAPRRETENFVLLGKRACIWFYSEDQARKIRSEVDKLRLLILQKLGPGGFSSGASIIHRSS